jgi:hypothetical protein
MFLENDCTIYKTKGLFDINILQSSTYKFENYKIKKINEQTLELIYTWLDPIKIQDKITTKDLKQVVFWYFKEEEKLCCFGSSESYTGYAVAKLEKLLKIEISKIEIFDLCKNKFIAKIKWFADLVNFHIYIGSMNAFNEEEVKKIPVKSVDFNQAINYIKKYHVTNFTYSYNNKYFYIDHESVLSFPDFSNDEDKYNVLQKACIFFK